MRLEEQDDLLLEKISRRIKFHELPSREAYLRLLRHGGHGSIEHAVTAMKAGATDYITAM